MGHAGQSDGQIATIRLLDWLHGRCFDLSQRGEKNAGGLKNSYDGSVPLSVPARAVEGLPLSGMQHH